MVFLTRLTPKRMDKSVIHVWFIRRSVEGKDKGSELEDKIAWDRVNWEEGGEVTGQVR